MAAPIATKLVLNTKNFTKGLNMAGKGLKGFGALAGGAIGIVTKLGLALTAASAAVAALIMRQANLIDRLGKVSDVIGINIQSLQKFRFAAEQSGIGSDQADVALRRFVRRLGEAQKGVGELLPALRRLGIDVKDSSGNFKSAEDILFEFADGIKNTEGAAAKLALAFKAFDSEGAELVKVLENGSAGMRAFYDEAVDLGFILDRETVKGVEKFNDEMNKLQLVVSGAANQFVAALAPALEQGTKDLIAFFKTFKGEDGTFKELGLTIKDAFIDVVVKVIEIFEMFTSVLAVVANGVYALGRVLGASGIPELSEDVKEARERFEALDRAMKALEPTGSPFVDIKPAGAIFPAIQALGALGDEFEEFKTRYSNMSLLDKILDINSKAGAQLAADLKVALEAAISEAEAGVNEFKGIDAGSLIAMLLGHKEDAKEAAGEVVDGIVEEVVAVGKKLPPSLLDKVLDAMFPVELVDKFFDTYDNEAASSAEKIVALFELVGKSIEKALPNLTTKFAAAGIGLHGVVKNLEDGLVKAASMFEDSLVDAVITGKANFSDLAAHLKQVLAKALIQKFFTGPLFDIMGLAKGGPAQGGKPYIVGEEGPELFVPNTSGTVIPNGTAIGGGGGVTNVNYSIVANDASSFKSMLMRDPEFLFNVTQMGARRLPS